MCEWHVTPDYIINNWSDEELNLMIKSMNKRLKKREGGKPPQSKPVLGMVPNSNSEEAFFINARNLVKHIRKD
jgi:hypothetical protein